MKPITIGLWLAVGLSAVTIDKRCLDASSCSTVNVDEEIIKVRITGFHDLEETFGTYLERDQPLVPANEAPFKEIRDRDGWLAVATVGLSRGYDLFGASVRAYLYNSRGELQATVPADYAVDSWRLGRFLGTRAAFFQLSSSGPQGYSVNTIVYALHDDGKAVEALTVNGTVRRVQPQVPKEPPGLWIDVPTYDGVNHNTKGWLSVFWRFDDKQGTFVRIGPSDRK